MSRKKKIRGRAKQLRDLQVWEAVLIPGIRDQNENSSGLQDPTEKSVEERGYNNGRLGNAS
jgi:hypothetical protein